MCVSGCVSRYFHYTCMIFFCLILVCIEPEGLRLVQAMDKFNEICIHDGDVNNDALLSAGDAQSAFYIALGIVIPTTEEYCSADCNDDGVVSSGDAQTIFTAALGSGTCTDPIQTVTPTDTPSPSPTDTPSPSPTDTPSPSPTDTPSPSPTNTPSLTPTSMPSETPTPTPIPADVVFNEIAWMGTLASISDEWIELFNNTSLSINLTNWQICEVNQLGEHIVITTLSGSIAPSGYYLIERTDNDTVSDIPADRVTSFGGYGLHDDGEHLILKDNTGEIIDFLNCSSASGGWFAGFNNTTVKYTMERIHTTLPGNLSSNWRTNDGCLINGLDANDTPINGSPRSENSVIVPTAPDNLGLDYGDGNVDVSWSIASDAGRYPILGYTIYRREVATEFALLATVLAPDLSYRDETVENDTLYYYMVRTIDTVSHESHCHSVIRNVVPGPPPDTCSNIYFSEIMFYPIGDEPNAEWIELYNPTEAIIDISDWQLIDNENGMAFDGRYTFPADTVISPGQRLVLAYSEDAAPGHTDIIYGVPASPDLEGQIALDNTSDKLTLRDDQWKLVDLVQYQGNWIHQQGRSLCRKVCQRNSQYIEIYNKGDQAIPLAGLSISDSINTDVIVPYTRNETLLLPGHYALMIHSQFQNNYDVPFGTIIVSSGDLNIGNELTPSSSISLLFGDETIDTYTQSFAPDIDISVERMNPLIGDTPDNWNLCLDPSGNTAGRSNSVSTPIP